MTNHISAYFLFNSQTRFLPNRNVLARQEHLAAKSKKPLPLGKENNKNWYLLPLEFGGAICRVSDARMASIKPHGWVHVSLKIGYMNSISSQVE